MTKKDYINDAKNRFSGKSLEIVLNQIELFFSSSDYKIEKNKYGVGEEVFLKKGTFMHGIFPEKEIFDYTIDNGFIAIEFSDNSRKNKISNIIITKGVANSSFFIKNLSNLNPIKLKLYK